LKIDGFLFTDYVCRSDSFDMGQQEAKEPDQIQNSHSATYS